MFGLREWNSFIRIIGQTEPVIISLNGIISETTRTRSGLASPRFVKHPGHWFLEFRPTFPPKTKIRPGSRGQISFIGGIDEHPAPIDLQTSLFPVHHLDPCYPAVLPDHPGRVGVKLAPGLNLDLFPDLLQHFLKHRLRHMRFEPVPITAVGELRRINPIGFLVMFSDPTHEFHEQSPGSTPSGDIGSPKTIGRQTTDMLGALQQDH
jgi:hypothetical protein